MIQKIGLCICLYDIHKASDGLIGHGTGIVNVNGRDLVPIFKQRARLSSFFFLVKVHRLTYYPLVEFRVIVFRPFKGEIILGRISSASEFGMKSTFVRTKENRLLVQVFFLTGNAVALDFFDDIFIPPHLLFPGSFL